jgi:hypothetical protein
MATVEMAMLAPLFLAGLLMIAQVLAWATAQLCASYAANHALQTTRIQGGTPAAGRDDATAVLTGIDGSLIDNPQIIASRDATTATVHIHGTAVRIVPFLALPVGADVSGPVEALNP